MPPSFVSGAVEGITDEPILRCMIESRGGTVHRLQVQHGKPNLRRALPGYNAAAERALWLVLVDLDDDYPCAGALVADWLPRRSRNMCLRVAVRQMESWLLADAERFSTFFSVRRNRIPLAPDALPNAKTTLVQLAAQSGRKAIRQDMTPRPGSGRRVGPAYASRIIEFAQGENGWRPDVAAARSPSLRRCLDRLDEMLSS